MTRLLLASPAVALVLGLLVGPLAMLVRLSFAERAPGRGFYVPGTWTLANFDGGALRLAGATLLFAALVALLSLAVAYPLAMWLRRLSPILRRIALACVLMPKLASALAVLFGLMQLLSASGPFGLTLSHSLLGAVLAEALLVLPYAVLVLHLQLSAIDPSLEEAARGLGASPWQVFRRVTLPLSLPGLLLAAQLSLLWGIGAFLGPMLLGGPREATLGSESYRQWFELSRWPRAAALATLLLLLSALALVPWRKR
ncbi:MAG: ABC transporter permease subunit [Gemmataceae bacterium]|nr:ABC transporter permease subunit [Gemmataceae bacterium]